MRRMRCNQEEREQNEADRMKKGVDSTVNQDQSIVKQRSKYTRIYVLYRYRH